MSKTVILWLSIYSGGMLTSLFKGPIYALLVYLFTFYTQFSWARGLSPDNRWSLYSAIAVVISYVIHYKRRGELALPSTPPLKWLVFFSINMLLVTPFAVDPSANIEMVTDVIKLIILYYLIIKVVNTKKNYNMFLWTQLWGNFLFGWQAYDHKLTHGRLEGIGGPQTNKSNSLANHLIMILPFINNFFFYGNKWEKLAVIFAAPWILNAIILCNSRGAFLGILAICIVAIIRSKKEVRKKIVVGMTLGAILFALLANDRFWSRMDTINDPNQKGSGRIETWLAAIEMIKDYPLGTGGDGWLYYSPLYIPDIVAEYEGQKRSVHNSYLEVCTNFGIQGLVIYFFFIYSTLAELHRIRKRSGTADDAFYQVESIAIEMSIWGFLVAATFGARPYFEGFFWFSALGMALSHLQQSELFHQKSSGNKVQENLLAASH